MRSVRSIAASIAGTAVVAAGKFVAAAQTALRLQQRGRPLTPDERALLWSVYRDSIGYDGIRIVEGRAGLFGVNKRPFTLGNTIYLKHLDPTAHPSTLVHECCHVWQNQHEGSRYAVEALWAQATVRPNAYHWADEFGRGRASWREFNKEAQAQFLQDVYRSGKGASAAGTAGSFYDGDVIARDARFEHHGTDYTDFARDTIAYVRGLPPP